MRPILWTVAASLALPCAIPLAAMPPGASTPAEQRAAMVARIRERVRQADPAADDAALERALQAVATIPRERFVDRAQRAGAYGDAPLPIGHDQTISDAYIQTVMTAAADLPPHANVLDIGTGSGYQAALLARLADHVVSIEIVKPLADQARKRLRRLRLANVEVITGDGYAGWPARAPFDAIIVSAGTDRLPQPLLDQLRIGSRLVMPVGASWASEQIIVVTKLAPARYARCSLGWTMFVPLIGRGARAAMAQGLYDNSVPLCRAAPLSTPVATATNNSGR